MQELESAKMLNLDLQQRLNEAVNAREASLSFVFAQC